MGGDWGDMIMVILTIIGTALLLLGIFVSLCANISDFGESSEGVSEEDLPDYTYPIVWIKRKRNNLTFYYITLYAII